MARVLAFDRRQRGTFRKSFEEYAANPRHPARIKRAKQLMQRHVRATSRASSANSACRRRCSWQSGRWKATTGTGDMGKLPVIRTRCHLAHDCRRSELSRRASRRFTDRPARRSSLRDLIGALRGRDRQTQFLPSSYIKYGVDYDGNGHVDLRHSVPDVLASTANLLKTNGWRAGAPFGEGTANFDVMSEWNRSVVYRKTMVLFAERLANPEAQLESPIKSYCRGRGDACRCLPRIEGTSPHASFATPAAMPSTTRGTTRGRFRMVGASLDHEHRGVYGSQPVQI